MSTQSITPEQKPKILAALKSGTSVSDLAKEYHVAEDTIKELIQKDSSKTSAPAKDTPKVPSTAGDNARLRKENQQLRDILGAFLIEKELAKKTVPRP